MFNRFWRAVTKRAGLCTLWFLTLQMVQAQEVLTNGARHDGVLSAASEADSWTFNAEAGATILLRLGGTNFPPRLRVYDSGNALRAEVGAGSLATRDVMLTLVATNGGPFTVLASSTTAAIGGYALHYIQVPAESFTVSPGDEGGTLQNGANNAGTITVGDLDAWSFTANAADRFMLRMGGAFTPLIRVYNPAGALVGEAVSQSLNTRDLFLNAVATNAGRYVVVAASTVAGSVGSYNLHLAKAPEEIVVSPQDEGGVLTNGVSNVGTISVGDLDVWQFQANAGDALTLRMGAAFTPWIRLHGPDGALVGEAVAASLNTRDVMLLAKATNSGTYTVIASSSVGGNSGEYHLHLAKAPGNFAVSPGDEGGELVNGAKTPGIIQNGDLDLWRFSANAGDQLVIRMGAEFTPLVRLYGPDGALAGEAVSLSLNTRDVVLNAVATNSGTYLVVASSTVASGTGNYNLHLAQVPKEFSVSASDEGGKLSNGSSHAGEISLGDLDLWSFEAQAGESFMLRMGAEFTPSIRVYAPNGAIAGDVVSGSLNTRDLPLNGVATNAGTYTVVIQSTTGGGIGKYTLSFVKPQVPLLISTNDQGGLLINGRTNLAEIVLGDLDAWSFTGTVGDSNVFRVTATNFAPALRLFGPTGAVVAESNPSSINTRSATLIYELTNNPGNYTIVLSSGVGGQIGGYSFKQSRWAPDLIVSGATNIDEGQTLSLSLTAEDPDEPNKPLEFRFVSGPPGVNFAIAGATNATLTWPTTEATGPSTNRFVVTVTDVVNNRSFTRTNSFDVIVREINVAPQLSVPGTIALNELGPLNAVASATDIDLPTNRLTFALIDPPQGMVIDNASGVISWIPTEAQAPSTNQVTVVVTDDSPNAANEKNLSDTKSFTVIVREINEPPLLTVPSPQAVDELSPLLLSLPGTDPDLPQNGRVFGLVSGPPGLTVDALTGEVRWIPSEEQGASTNTVVVSLADSSPLAVNATSLSVTNSFVIVVREVNNPPELSVPPTQTITELSTLRVTATASDSDRPANPLTFSLLSHPEGMIIDANSGAITWTPSEGQGPSTNTVSVVVADNNVSATTSQRLSVTNSFVVVVTESNSPPVLPAIGLQTINEGATLTLTNRASDADLPANTLSYRLLSGPTNAAIDASGTITWTPTEAQGPSTNTIVTVATDNGIPALSVTNAIIVVVNEVNAAPVLEAIANRAVRFGELFTIQALASDPDLPANTLTYTVQGASGVTIDGNGLLSWTPLQAQTGTHNLTVSVTDNGSPAAVTSRAFQVTVTGEETSLAIARLPNGLIQITIRGNSGVNYELQRSTNLSDWTMQFEFRLTTSPFLYIDPEQNQEKRFYRLRTAP